MDRESKGTLDKLYDRAKKDLILIPRGVRIWIDVILAIVIFAAMVLYPAYCSLKLGVWGSLDCIYICVGTFTSCLMFFFAYKAIRQNKQNNEK